MLGKHLELSKMRSQNQRYERLLSKEAQLLALDPERPGKGSGPYYSIVQEAIEAFFRYGADVASSNAHRATLRMGHVENAIQRSVAEQTIRYEAKMVVLGSIVTGAPFLGLLGTVWGVMDALRMYCGRWLGEPAEFGAWCIGCFADDSGWPRGSDPIGFWV